MMSHKVFYGLLTATVLMIGLLVWVLRSPQVFDEQAGTAPPYTVLYRESVRDVGRADGRGFFTGTLGDILIPSLTREDESREEIFRTIAAEEAFDVAIFHATEASFRAHRAQLKDEEHREALRVGLLGELREGKFTPGETSYP